MASIIDDNIIKQYKQLKGIRVLYANMGSLNHNKMDQFRLIVNQLAPDMVCITETWFNDTVQDIEVAINGYNLIRNDRSDKKGGGIAIYYNSSRMNVNVIDYSTNFELLLVDVKHNMTKHFKLAVIYRPPGPECEFLELFDNFLVNYTDEELIITGDFNIDLMKENKKYEKIFSAKYYKQLILEPTRVTKTSQTLIDHIFTNFYNNITGSGVLDLSLSVIINLHILAEKLIII